MRKTIEVAKDRKYDPEMSVIPREYSKGVIIEHAASAPALKLAHQMIAVAGGRMAEDRWHEMRTADLREIKGMRHCGKDDLVPLFAELRAMTYSYDDTDKLTVDIGGFMDHAKVQYRFDDHGDLKVRWRFSSMFQEMAAKSTHWAIMDRQTVFALRSKYSILLYQYLSNFFGLKHKTSVDMNMGELRTMLNVEAGKLNRFADLNNRAIKHAVAEISQLSRFNITVEKVKEGRYVKGVRFSWAERSDQYDLKRELDSPQAGRKARREGKIDAIIDEAFPASGSISYSEPWRSIARQHGNGKDINMIAQDFRKWCSKKSIKLDAKSIENIFTGFCKQAKT